MRRLWNGLEYAARHVAAGIVYVVYRLFWVLTFIFSGVEFLNRFFRYLHRILLFEHRQDDVFICSYPRSGTTWSQMLLYQVMTDGDMDFPHISAVVPYFETTLINRSTMSEMPSPRLIKTHVKPWRLDMNVGKYIYVSRDVKDVLVSFYHFHRSHKNFRGSFDEFVEKFQSGRVQYGSWFRHIASWMKMKDRPNVLFITYEELATKRRDVVRRVADFCGVALTPDKLERICERTSFEFMKKHESKFDYLNEMLREKGFAQGQYIREGKTGAGASALRPEQIDELERRAAAWRIPADPPGRLARAAVTANGA